MTIIRTTGNSKPHIIAPGYQRQSDQSARWGRDQPSRLSGPVCFIVIVFALLAFGQWWTGGAL